MIDGAQNRHVSRRCDHVLIGGAIVSMGEAFNLRPTDALCPLYSARTIAARGAAKFQTLRFRSQAYHLLDILPAGLILEARQTGPIADAEQGMVGGIIAAIQLIFP